MGRLAALSVAVALLASCAPAEAPSPAPETGSVEAARAELRDLIVDVTAATVSQFGLVDTTGAPMDTAKVIWGPDVGQFIAVYHTGDDAVGFQVQVATSDDVLTWTPVATLADLASQPTIAAATDGGYVVAWEQQPDPIHLAIAYYPTWDALRSGTPSRRLDPPVTMPACGEGTPSITAASTTRVDLGFHYHGGCVRDRQATGTTDWTSWSAVARPDRDQALVDQGVTGHMGDRDTITFRGHDLMLMEGQLVLDDFSSWRTFLYDDETHTAELLPFKTPANSVAVSNPTITEVEIDGQDALLVTLYLMGSGSPSPEDGPLLYYRTLSDGP